MFKKFWNRYIALPSVISLGRSDINALSFGSKKGKPQEYTWASYYEETRHNFPIRYFINRTIPKLFSPIRNVVYKIITFIYWAKCHVLKSHKFHIIDIRQPKNSYHHYRYGWIDADIKLLYAAFTILVDFVEKEKPANLLNSYTMAEIKASHLESTLALYNETMELYRWWTIEREKDQAADLKYQNSDIRYQKDSDMLIRLIKIRQYLWT